MKSINVTAVIYINDEKIDELEVNKNQPGIGIGSSEYRIKPGSHKLNVIIIDVNGSRIFNKSLNFKVENEFTIDILIKENELEINIIEEKPERKNNNNLFEGKINLKCELPTDILILPDLKLQPEVITNQSEAYEFAIQYFPEFKNCEFLETYSDKEFILRIGSDDNSYEYIDIDSTGTIIYSKNTDSEPVEDTIFTENMAFNIAQHFLSKHGGVGDFIYDYTLSGRKINEKGEPTGIIIDYTFHYIYYYKNIPIRGYGDKMFVTVTPEEEVNHYFRLKRTVIEEIANESIISASEAYNSLKNNVSVISEMNIIDVEICYFSKSHYKAQEIMQPAWRFEFYGEGSENDTSYLYISGRDCKELTP